MISADLSINAVVVVAKPEEYRIVESAIRRLDVLPAQVIVEATIAEVQLNDALRHGVRWFFESGQHGVALNGLDGSTGSILPGFSYTFKVPNA